MLLSLDRVPAIEEEAVVVAAQDVVVDPIIARQCAMRVENSKFKKYASVAKIHTELMTSVSRTDPTGFNFVIKIGSTVHFCNEDRVFITKIT